MDELIVEPMNRQALCLLLGVASYMTRPSLSYLLTLRATLLFSQRKKIAALWKIISCESG